MHLFLQGNRQIGKSTLIHTALKQVASRVAGFQTQHLIHGGNIIGHRAVAVSGALPPLEIPYDKNLDGIFLLYKQRDTSVLEKVITQARDSAKSSATQLILLDEIGGFELNSNAFMQALHEIFAIGKPCIGVLKSASNLAHTSMVLKLGAEYPALHEDLEQFLSENGNVLTVTEANIYDVQCEIEAFVRETLKI